MAENLDGDICSKPITNKRAIPVIEENQERNTTISPENIDKKKKRHSSFFLKFCNSYKWEKSLIEELGLHYCLHFWYREIYNK